MCCDRENEKNKFFGKMMTEFSILLQSSNDNLITMITCEIQPFCIRRIIILIWLTSTIKCIIEDARKLQISICGDWEYTINEYLNKIFFIYLQITVLSCMIYDLFIDQCLLLTLLLDICIMESQNDIIVSCLHNYIMYCKNVFFLSLKWAINMFL